MEQAQSIALQGFQALLFHCSVKTPSGQLVYDHKNHFAFLYIIHLCLVEKSFISNQWNNGTDIVKT